MLNHTKTVYLTEDEIKQVNDWRRLQTKIPSFSEAIRTLINLTLLEEKKE